MTAYFDQVSVIRAAQYDGTNAQEILDNFNAEVVSEVAGVLTYRTVGIPANEYTANVGQYINWSSPQDASMTFATDALMEFPMVVLP